MRTFQRPSGTRLALWNAFPPVNWRATFRGAYGTDTVIAQTQIDVARILVHIAK
jgi:hypothetical protein